MRTVVAVLRGGPSSEYDVSLRSGASVLAALDMEKYEPRDIFIDRAGQWHLHGIGIQPEKALFGADVVFNALHGHFGEDGQVQSLLDRLAVPYTGSGALASAVAFNKNLTKEAAKKVGVKVAHSVVVDIGDTESLAHKLFRTFPHPSIVKPVVGGSSVGTAIAHNFHQLQHALDTAFVHGSHALVEEYIKGREATVGVIDNFRNESVYALMPVEIVLPPNAAFFDYENKYNGATLERVPGNFNEKEKRELQRVAKAMHKAVGLAHYSRSDFIVSKRGVYFLEINSLPGLTTESLLPKALSAVGASLSQFVDHVLHLARGRSR